MNKNIKTIILVVFVIIVIAVAYELYTVLEPVFTTTTSEYHYTHAAAENVSIVVLCATPHDCPVSIINSSGDTINVTIRTTVPKNAEYKGSQKVRDSVQRNVTFLESDNGLMLKIWLMEGSEMFQLVPSTAYIDVGIPSGVNYTLTKQWPYHGHGN
jgi:regulatory protein YycH of two-component signal transduction system YycFG